MRRQRARLGLAKGLTLRGEHHHLRGVIRQRLDCFKDRLGLEHHSRAATVGFVVHSAVPVMRPVP